jgi:4-amino-4-deoxy-L-arabinose transferase-like glycosyltransferase
VLLVPWALGALLAIPAMRGRAAAAIALVEAAPIVGQLIYRHSRNFSEGVARLWPVRIYVGSGLLLLSVLLLAACWLLWRRVERRRAAVGIVIACSALLPFWLVLAGLTYSA